jgi:hypothetical protein
MTIPPGIVGVAASIGTRVADVGFGAELKEDFADTVFVGSFVLGAFLDGALFAVFLAAAFTEDFLALGLMGGIRSTFILDQIVNRL